VSKPACTCELKEPFKAEASRKVSDAAGAIVTLCPTMTMATLVAWALNSATDLDGRCCTVHTRSDGDKA
jgi:predicted phosphatase